MTGDGPALPARKKKEAKLKGAYRAAYQCLFDLINDGETVERPNDVRVPVGVTTVTLVAFRSRLKKRGIINPDGNYREEFKRILVTLSNAGFIGVWDLVVWPVT